MTGGDAMRARRPATARVTNGRRGDRHSLPDCGRRNEDEFVCWSMTPLPALRPATNGVESW